MRTVARLGATGYTGRLVAAELDRRGVPHVLAGRSQARLEALPASSAEASPRRVVDLDRPETLDALLEGADVLVSCVGPFALHGRPAVEAAVRTGTPYVDSTGEPDFVREVLGRWRGHDGPPLVPACGFDYVPSDLAAAVAAEEAGGDVEEVRIVYRARGGRPSRGTARSALGAATSTAWAPRSFVVEDADGEPVTAVELPWGDQALVPLHVVGAVVRSGFAVGAPVARALDAARPLVALSAPVLRRTAPALGRLVERLPEGPDDAARGRFEVDVLVEARRPGGRGRVAVRLRDVYGLTARLLVAAAQQVEGRGALAPAEALPARSFLDGVTGEDRHGALSWRVL